MTQRIDITKVVPDGVQALLGVEKYVNKTIDHTVLELLKTRASMTNQCSHCVDRHTREAMDNGESPQRLFGIAAWRESSLYDDRERAALALTDAVTILGPDGVPDEVWDEAVRQFDREGAANLLIAIGTINLWNRIAITCRTPLLP
jgi:AhpD family alkylhydroperoxidase